MQDKNTVNKVILMGRVGDVMQPSTVSFRHVVCFSLITIEKFQKHGGIQVHEEIHQIEVSDKMIDIAEIVPGTVMYIQGRLQTRAYTDQDHIKRYESYIAAVNAEILDMNLLLLD